MNETNYPNNKKLLLELQTAQAIFRYTWAEKQSFTGFCPENFEWYKNNCKIMQCLGGLELLLCKAPPIHCWSKLLLPLSVLNRLHHNTRSWNTMSPWPQHMVANLIPGLGNKTTTIFSCIILNNAWEYSSGCKDASCGQLIPSTDHAQPLMATVGRTLYLSLIWRYLALQ